MADTTVTTPPPLVLSGSSPSTPPPLVLSSTPSTAPKTTPVTAPIGGGPAISPEIQTAVQNVIGKIGSAVKSIINPGPALGPETSQTTPAFTPSAMGTSIVPAGTPVPGSTISQGNLGNVGSQEIPANGFQDFLSSIHIGNQGLPTGIVNNPVTTAIGNSFDDAVNKTSTFLKTLDSGKPNPAVGKTMDNAAYDRLASAPADENLNPAQTLEKYGTPVDAQGNPTNIDTSPSNRLGTGLEAITGLVNFVLSPIGGVFNLTTSLPLEAKNPVTYPLAIPKFIAEAGGWSLSEIGKGATLVSNALVDKLPISQTTKNNIKKPLSDATSLVAQIIVGDLAVEKGLPLVKDKLAVVRDLATKDVVANTIKTKVINVDVDKAVSNMTDTQRVDFFTALQRYSDISPENAQQVKDAINLSRAKTGTPAPGYPEGTPRGLNIQVPSESLKYMVDKPWWAALKKAIGIGTGSINQEISPANQSGFTSQQKENTEGVPTSTDDVKSVISNIAEDIKNPPATTPDADVQEKVSNIAQSFRVKSNPPSSLGDDIAKMSMGSDIQSLPISDLQKNALQAVREGHVTPEITEVLKTIDPKVFGTANESKIRNGLVDEAKKYNNADEFVHSQLKKSEYLGDHRPDFTGDTADSIQNIKSLRKEIVQGKHSNDIFSKLEKMQGKPDLEVIVFRSSPTKELNLGDWVTLDKDYAHRMTNNIGGKTYSFKVKAGDLVYNKGTNSGNGFNFGYVPKIELINIYNKAHSLDENGKPIDNGTHDTTRTTGSIPANSQSKGNIAGGSPAGLETSNKWNSVAARKWISDNSGTSGIDSEQYLRYESELREGKPIELNHSIINLLKAGGFSDPLIQNLKTAFDAGGVKNISFATRIGKNDIYAAYTDDRLFLNPFMMDNYLFTSGDIIQHELNGHAWYYKLSDSDRTRFYESLKDNKAIIKQGWEDGIQDHNFYWDETVKEIYSAIVANSNSKKAQEIMDFVGISANAKLDLDTFIDRSLNLDKKIDAINQQLLSKGDNPITIKAENTPAINEHVAMIAENAKNMLADDSSMVGRYIGDIQDGKLSYGENGVSKLTYREELSSSINEDDNSISFRQQSEDLDQLRNQLDRTEQSIAEYKKNPEAYIKAYGPERINQRNAQRITLQERIQTIEQRNKEGKNPVFQPGSSTMENLRATLAQAEERVGVKPVEPVKSPEITQSIKPTPKEIELPPQLQEAKDWIDILKDTISNDRAKGLDKYYDSKEGGLPEPSDSKFQGDTRKLSSYWKSHADEISANLGYEDSNEAREDYQRFLNLKKQYKGAVRELSQAKETWRKATIAEKKAYIAQTKQEAIIAREEVKMYKNLTRMDALTAKEQALEYRRQELEKAQQKVNTEAQKKSDLKIKLQENHLEPPESDKLNTLNPLLTKTLQENHPEVVTAYKKFSALNNLAKLTGLKHADTMPEIDNMGTIDIHGVHIPKSFDEYQHGHLPKPYQKQIHDFLEGLYQTEKDTAFEDLSHRENYLPQVYKGGSKEIENAKRAKLASLGLTPAEIEKYLKGVELNKDKAVHLKLNPFFSKERFFDTYAEAATYGLKPKFDKMTDLLAYRESESLKTRASRGLVNDLTEAGELVATHPAPGWLVNTYGPAGIESHYSSPIVHAFLQNYFKGVAEAGNLERKLITPLSKLSKFVQFMSLSTGVPFTPIDPFSLGILSREITRGNFKAVQSYIQSFSTKSTRQYLQENYKYIEMMARNNVPFHEGISGLVPAQHESLKDRIETLKTKVKNAPLNPASYSPIFGVMKGGLREVFGKKAFENFIPLVQLQTFKDSYTSLTKQGMPDEQAQEMAASITRMTLGIMQDVARGKMTENYLSAAFYAPQYREGMVNIWANMLASLNPITRKLIIEPPVSGEGPGNAKYKYSAFAKGSPIRDPKYSNLRKLVVGAILMYTAYNILNKELTGHWMWENPSGKEFDLQLPPDKYGNISFITWEPSFATVPRAILGAGVFAAQGDTKSAFEKGSQIFSSVITTAVDILTNTNYYGNPIYKTTDSPTQKDAKITAYGAGELTPSYIKALISEVTSQANATTTTPAMPLYQAIATATALPVTFSTTAKEETNDIFNLYVNQQQETANLDTQAEAEFQTMQKLPSDQVIPALAQLAKTNKPLAEKVATIITDSMEGLTATDRAMKLLDVTNGARAQAMYQHITSLPKESDRQAYIADQLQKKLIDAQVYGQILTLIKTNGKSFDITGASIPSTDTTTQDDSSQDFPPVNSNPSNIPPLKF